MSFYFRQGRNFYKENPFVAGWETIAVILRKANAPRSIRGEVLWFIRAKIHVRLPKKPKLTFNLGPGPR